MWTTMIPVLHMKEKLIGHQCLMGGPDCEPQTSGWGLSPFVGELSNFVFVL